MQQRMYNIDSPDFIKKKTKKIKIELKPNDCLEAENLYRIATAYTQYTVHLNVISLLAIECINIKGNKRKHQYLMTFKQKIHSLK